MFEALEIGHVTILVALELSTAFDAIDHTVLVERIEHSFGITGSDLSWVCSVRVRGTLSNIV